MKVRFSNNAYKFIDKIEEKEKDRIRSKVKTLVTAIENQGIIPFKELNIKKLTGDWLGYFRIRIGKIRVIFCIDRTNDELLIYEIDFRGSVYK